VREHRRANQKWTTYGTQDEEKQNTKNDLRKQTQTTGGKDEPNKVVMQSNQLISLDHL
jgi:hypothetical protein